jgi:hypothetical protein
VAAASAGGLIPFALNHYAPRVYRSGALTDLRVARNFLTDVVALHAGRVGDLLPERFEEAGPAPCSQRWVMPLSGTDPTPSILSYDKLLNRRDRACDPVFAANFLA